MPHMPLFPPSVGRLTVRPPDFTEARGDRVLLIWGDLPYWTVVDREFHELLLLLDGTRTLDTVLAERPDWAAQRRVIRAGLAALRAAGVFMEHAAKRPAAAPKIENVALNLTRRCNLRCRACYNLPHLTRDADGEVTADEVIGFLREVKPHLGKQATLTILGGEPLLEPDRLLAICAAAHRMGLTNLVSTNGTRVTEEFARGAARIGLQVQVSLDGHTPALNDRLRGAGSFQQAVAGVRTLVAAGAHVIVSGVIHADNLRHLEAYYDFARGLGVRETRFIPLKRMGGAPESALQPVPLTELLHHAAAMLARRPEFRSLMGRDALSILANTCRLAARKVSCGTGLQTVLLDSDGSLYPCLNTNVAAFRLGNIRDAGFQFRRLWRDSATLAAVRDATRADIHAPCPVRAWCLGGCHGENYALTGRLDARPPHCDDLKRGIIAMCWLLTDHPDLGPPNVTAKLGARMSHPHVQQQEDTDANPRTKPDTAEPGAVFTPRLRRRCIRDNQGHPRAD
jgi:radical SAM protein with 4Fe4S-binding SPASM domain